MNSHSDRVRLVALLAALSIMLSTIEFLIPKPVPFMRLGLANLPILIGLPLLNRKEHYTLISLKVIGQGVINGTLLSYIFVFSALGSFASGTVMMLAYRGGGRHFSMLGISLVGALASNSAQLLLAWLIIFGDSVRLVAPPMVATGSISAIILGYLADRFLRSSLWIQAVRELPR